MSKDEKAVEKIEEDAPFDVEAFDEKEFIRKELISFRTTAVLFVFSILVAAITFFVWRSVEGLRFPLLALLALAIGIAFMRLIFKVTRIDISHWKRREWIGTFFLFFFFWLGFILLFVNPPFTDAASPKVEVAAVPAAQRPGANVELGAYVADNKGLAGDPSFCVHRFEGSSPPAYDGLSETEKSSCATTFERLEGQPFWHHNATFSAGRYAFYVLVQDADGQASEERSTFNVSSPFIGNVSLPRDNRFEGSDDALTVRLHPQVFARSVQFSLDGGGSWHNFVPHTDPVKKDQNYWRTDPTYEGWTVGTHDVTLRVRLQPVFLRDEAHVLRGVAEDPNGPYSLTVAPSIGDVGATKIDYGRNQNDYPEFRFFNPGQTPGLGAPALLALVGAIVVAGRRRGG